MPRTKKIIIKKVKKRGRQVRPELRALLKIKRDQMTHARLIPKIPFQQVVREIIRRKFPGLRIEASALPALQEVAAAALTEFKLANLAAIRAALQVKNMRLIREIRSLMIGYPDAEGSHE
ncbi:MAG: hypothetical protein M1840_008704 [Geoglossum simile]|nr:MAG: hypothetical protein M1840_008704 [Geoglossum simile]